MGYTFENKNSKTITEEFSKILTTSKRSPLKSESDRGAEFYNKIYKNFLKAKNKQHYSRFTDKSLGIAEGLSKPTRNLLKQPVFETGTANWLSELRSVIKKYNYTIHSSKKINANQASKKIN